MTAVKEIPHGTLSGYRHHKCRCDECKAVNSRYAKEWRIANRDRSNELKRAWKARNPDWWRNEDYAKVLERQSRYRAAHPERERERHRKWAAENPVAVAAKDSRRRARKLAAPSAPYTAQQIEQRWAMWGNRCWLNPSHPAEATDHVKPLAAGGADMLANFRPICHSCNASKGAKWPLDLSSIALQRDPATAGSKPPTLTKGN